MCYNHYIVHINAVSTLELTDCIVSLVLVAISSLQIKRRDGLTRETHSQVVPEVDNVAFVIGRKRSLYCISLGQSESVLLCQAEADPPAWSKRKQAESHTSCIDFSGPLQISLCIRGCLINLAIIKAVIR